MVGDIDLGTGGFNNRDIFADEYHVDDGRGIARIGFVFHIEGSG